jgi:hypothetical protein
MQYWKNKKKNISWSVYYAFFKLYSLFIKLKKKCIKFVWHKTGTHSRVVSWSTMLRKVACSRPNEVTEFV